MELKEQQRIEALVLANEIRCRRARLRKSLAVLTEAEAIFEVTDLLREPPAYLHTLEVGVLLGWIPHWGAVHIKRALRKVDLDPTRLLAGERPHSHRRRGVRPLTDREREELAVTLETGPSALQHVTGSTELN